MKLVKLHNLQVSDAQLFADLANDSRISQNSSDRFPHPYTLSDAETFIKRFSLRNPCSVFGIQYGTDLVGGIGLHFRDDIYRKTAELGYWVAPEYWGKGIAGEAIRLILDLGFSKFDLQVVVAHVFGRNLVSQHVLKKNGFTCLGTIPNGAFKLGKYEDDVVFLRKTPIVKNLVWVGLVLFVNTAFFAQIPQVQAGKIHRWENFHSEFIGNRTVDIWTPSIIDDTVIAFDVIYMHDGQMLFDSGITWNHQEWHIDETLQSLIDEGKVPPTMVVGIHNGGSKRHSEFFPRKVHESMNDSARRWCRQNGRDYSVASDSFAALSDAYLKFIVNELKPAVDSAFFVKKDRAHTFVGGSSMGGLISMYAVCEYPEVFGGALCFSTHWPGVWQTDGNPVPDLILAYMKGHLPDIRTHKWYFDLGDRTLDALYPPLQSKVDALMHLKGYNEGNWITRFFGGDDHSERSWSRRFGIAYGWLNPLP